MNKLHEIQQLSDEEFYQKFEKHAQFGKSNLIIWVQEGIRRENNKFNSSIEGLTKQMRNMTGVILFLTVIVVLLTVVNLLISIYGY